MMPDDVTYNVPKQVGFVQYDVCIFVHVMSVRIAPVLEDGLCK
jgi:hypothetical protein